MPQYVCVDGPLSGYLLEWRDAPVDGETLTVGVVDVDHDDAPTEGPPEADYVVERAAGPVEPGTLRYVARRGAWRTPPTAAEVAV